MRKGGNLVNVNWKVFGGKGREGSLVLPPSRRVCLSPKAMLGERGMSDNGGREGWNNALMIRRKRAFYIWSSNENLKHT